MMNTAGMLRSFGVAAISAALLAALGCETNKDVEDPASSMPDATTVDRIGSPSQNITITPASVTISNVSAEIVFTANGGQSPFSWSTANGNGTLSADDNQAIYTAVAIGHNSVVVTDGRGLSASAEINGSAPGLSAGANPSTLSHDGDKLIASADGGVPPYTWTVINVSLGAFVGSGNTIQSVVTGQNVVYMREHTGDNAITVTDASGNSANVVILQP